MGEQTVKEFLLKMYPPNVASLEDAYFISGEWCERELEEVQQISDKVIELFKELDMTYTDAYAMLGSFAWI
ncbi:hypothetical protein ACQKNB_18590 [Lysinibacillus xylanilyticus]|uniref:hypothetical protein n=1 Tax=Lysinibacillus xylanilyticus TaxID=582475 RepID=UPI003D08653B